MPILALLTNNNNNKNNCCCRNSEIIVRRRRDNITSQNARIAQFTSVGSQLIPANNIIPLTNTQFNNISSFDINFSLCIGQYKNKDCFVVNSDFEKGYD